MKFNKYFFGALLGSSLIWAILILAVVSVVGCGEESSKLTKRIIHGKAAIGAFIDEGAQVQVRPASIDGENPAEIINGVVGADGNYTIIIPEEIPAIPDEESVPLTKSGTSMENGTGFIIRVWSASAGSWVYSYAENNGPDTVANVNPYTDMFVRCIYNKSRVNQGNIDIYFPTGLKSDGTIMGIPTSEIVYKIMIVMSKMLYTVYGLSDIQNALLDNWEIDTGLDEMINNLGLGVNGFLYNEYFYLIQDVEIFNNASAISSADGQYIMIDVWTSYGNTGNVNVQATSLDGVKYSAVMEKQADSTENENHFKMRLGPWSYFQGDCVYISIDDYNGGLGNNVVVRKP